MQGYKRGFRRGFRSSKNIRRIHLGWLEFARRQLRLLLVIPHPNKFLPFISIFQECGEKTAPSGKKNIHVTTISICSISIPDTKPPPTLPPPPAEEATTATIRRRRGRRRRRRRSKTTNNLGLLHWGGDDAHGQYYRIVAFIVLLVVAGLGFFLALSLLYPWQDVGTGRFCFHSRACSWLGKGLFFTHWSWWES